MALATTCPSCSTSFKVHPEQLKLRRGLVRCGVCQHVFSGIKYVRYVSDAKNRSRRRRRKPAHADSAQTAQNTQPVAPETVVDDLNTAFFLPETRMDTSGNQTSPDTNDTDSRKASNSDSNNNGDATSAKRRQGRRNRRKGRRKSSNDADKSAAPTASETTDDTDTGSAVNRPASPTVDSVVVSRSRPDNGVARQSTSTTNRRSTTDRRADTRPAPEVTAPAAAALPMAFDTPDDTFPDTLQANLPAAWQAGDSSAIDWPDLDGNFTADRAPAESAESLADADNSEISNEPDENSTEPSARTAADSDEATRTSDDDAEDSIAHDREDLSTDEDQAHALAPSEQSDTTEPASDDSPNDTGDQSEEAVQGRDQRNADEADEEDAIDYFGRTTRPAFDFDLPPRNVQLLAVALAVLLGLQLVIGARDSLAARFSFTRPALETITSPLGLAIRPPVQVDDVKILSLNVSGPVSSDQKNDSHAYIMNLLLRNTGQLTAQWPAVELVVTDQSGGRLVQKVLMPADYLNDADRAAAGMQGNTEEYVRLNMRAHGIMITNIYGLLFYP